MIRLIAPPLPAASRPSKSTTIRRPLARTHSWNLTSSIVEPRQLGLVVLALELPVARRHARHPLAYHVIAASCAAARPQSQPGPCARLDPRSPSEARTRRGTLLDRTETTGIHEPSPAASRRIFRSKVDTIRPTYGFEDVSLAPGTETVEPSDVDLAPDLRGPRAAHPDPRVGDGRGGRCAVCGRAGAPRRPGGPQPRRRPDPLRRPGRGARRGSRPLPTTRCTVCSPRPTRRPIREDLIARRIDEIHAAGSPAAVAATPGAARRFGPVLRRARRGPVPRPEPGLVGAPPGVRATTRCRWRSSRASCRSRSRSATRPSPRPRSS